MVTGELKNKIDGIWNVFWTGGITVPTTIIEQITYLMFIKLLDDNQLKKEATANALGVTIKDKVFGDGICVISEEPRIEIPFAKMRWSYFHNEDPKTMFDIITKYVFPFIKTLGSGKEAAFSRYMKDAVFLVPSERVLGKVIAGIDGLDMNDKDTMGDIYEYMLGRMAASGDNGQFRTPRHIIKMMVQLMKPKPTDTMVDPAMGSAGFVVESAKFVSANYSKELLKKEVQEAYKTTMFSGFDTDQTMLRIGSMNLMLHGVDAPNIQYKDSLSEDNLEREKYSLILANPPFTGSLDSEAVAKDLLAISKTKKTEILFLALFTKLLKIGGRCASIVPDGVLFGSSNAHKAIRQEIINNQKLEAIISMPSGVFKPYAGVSTAIMIFTKTNAGGTDKVWFYDMKADGYSLDDKRSVIESNDIPDIIKRFRSPEEASRTRLDQSFYVDFAEIKENDYDLSLNKYKETIREKIEYDKPEVILGKIINLEEEINCALAEFKKLLEV